MKDTARSAEPAAAPGAAPGGPLDRIDRRLVDHLQANGRITNAELAEKVGLSPSACLRRVRELEAAGVIVGYVALVDRRAAGKQTDVFVEITLQAQSEEVLTGFEAAVATIEDVRECHLVSGEADYLLRVATGGAEDFERIHREHLSRLPAVARMRSSFALRTVCWRPGYPFSGRS